MQSEHGASSLVMASEYWHILVVICIINYKVYNQASSLDDHLYSFWVKITVLKSVHYTPFLQLSM